MQQKHLRWHSSLKLFQQLLQLPPLSRFPAPFSQRPPLSSRHYVTINRISPFSRLPKSIVGVALAARERCLSPSSCVVDIVAHYLEEVTTSPLLPLTHTLAACDPMVMVLM